MLPVVPAKLLLIEQSEFALYAIQHELEDKLAGRHLGARMLAHFESCCSWYDKTLCETC